MGGNSSVTTRLGKSIPMSRLKVLPISLALPWASM
jgi:hypothetical protein